jgi:hypothetical protein
MTLEKAQNFGKAAYVFNSDFQAKPLFTTTTSDFIGIKKGDVVDLFVGNNNSLYFKKNDKVYFVPKNIVSPRNAPQVKVVNPEINYTATQIPTWTIMLALVGLPAGLAYAHHKGSGFWGYVGYAILGNMVFAIPYTGYVLKNIQDLNNNIIQDFNQEKNKNVR